MALMNCCHLSRPPHARSYCEVCARRKVLKRSPAATPSCRCCEAAALTTAASPRRGTVPTAFGGGGGRSGPGSSLGGAEDTDTVCLIEEPIKVCLVVGAPREFEFTIWQSIRQINNVSRQAVRLIAIPRVIRRREALFDSVSRGLHQTDTHQHRFAVVITNDFGETLRNSTRGTARIL